MFLLFAHFIFFIVGIGINSKGRKDFKSLDSPTWFVFWYALVLLVITIPTEIMLDSDRAFSCIPTCARKVLFFVYFALVCLNGLALVGLGVYNVIEMIEFSKTCDDNC